MKWPALPINAILFCFAQARYLRKYQTRQFHNTKSPESMSLHQKYMYNTVKLLYTREKAAWGQRRR